MAKEGGIFFPGNPKRLKQMLWPEDSYFFQLLLQDLILRDNLSLMRDSPSLNISSLGDRSFLTLKTWCHCTYQFGISDGKQLVT